MKKIKFKGKVVVCVRRENGKWEKGEENKGIIGFQIKPLSEFSLFPSFPFSLFLHILHLAKVIQKTKFPRAHDDRGHGPHPFVTDRTHALARRGPRLAKA
jgi:hypothetical protein